MTSETDESQAFFYLDLDTRRMGGIAKVKDIRKKGLIKASMGE